MTKATNKSFVRSSDKPLALTPAEYSGLQAAYDHFNVALFDRALPDVFMTYQRKSGSVGYFLPTGSLVVSRNFAGTSSRSIQMLSSPRPTSRFCKRWCTRWRTCGSKSVARRRRAVIITKSGRQK